MKKILSILLCTGMLLANASVYADSYVMHTVQSGETLWTVSEKYNMELHQLERMNEDLGETLFEGNLIKIKPVSAGKDISIQIDGKDIPTDQVPYLENSRTFVPIRFIAQGLGIEDIHWDQATQTAILKHNGDTIYLTVGSRTARINENNVVLDTPVNIYNGRVFVPIRFVAETFQCTVDWNASNYTVHIQKQDNLTEDLYWLSRIIEAEAQGEPYDGKLAVANVIINRKNSSSFPNSIKEVIFDQEYGFQFTPVLNGEIYNNPSQDSINAAKAALQGNNNIGDALYFLNPKISESFWIVDNRTKYKSISEHDFYL